MISPRERGLGDTLLVPEAASCVGERLSLTFSLSDTFLSHQHLLRRELLLLNAEGSFALC